MSGTDTDMDGAWPLPTGRPWPPNHPERPTAAPVAVMRVELLGPEPEEARPVAEFHAHPADWQYSITLLPGVPMLPDGTKLYAAPPARPVAPAGQCTYPQCCGDEPPEGGCCRAPFTTDMAEAAERYFRSVGPNAYPLPAQFRWVDLFRAMLAASPAAQAPVAPVALTEEEIMRCIRMSASGTTIRLTRDVGPYEVTEPTFDAIKFVRAIERAHGITAPSAAEG